MRLVKLAFIAVIILLLPPTPSPAFQTKKNVLYINSYHNGYKWSDGLLEGVRTVLNASRYKVDLQIEYMDAKKFHYDTLKENHFALFKEKFANEFFDIVIISDNDALNFVNQYRDELFPGVPVVFCGINDLMEADLGEGNITGVVEVYDLVATLNVAKRLHPKRDRVVVLIDSSTAGVTIKRQAEKILEKDDLGIKVEFWIQLSLEEAQQRVSHLPDDTILFIAPYYQTINGRFYTSEEVSEAIYRHSTVPIYTAWEFMIGYGAVGGRVLSGIEHGRMAGEMALQILDGVAADQIPIVREPSGTYMFDYKVMEKLGIDRDLLPENSTIINAPQAIYAISKELFWTIMVSFILLLLALVAMLGAMLERRKVQLKIIEQLAFQETLMDTIPQLVSWKDLDGRYLGANRAFMDFFGIQGNQQVMGKSTADLLSDTAYSEWSVSADAAVIYSKKAFRKIRRRVTGKDGQEAWIEVNKVPLQGQGGKIVGVLSTAENITKEQNLEKQLLQSQKMEAIGTLAGGIAHDFNNILTSIINSTELAIGDIEPGTQTEADLQRVLKAARRGGRVVQQILSFSRPSREGFRPTDMGSVVLEVVHLMEASMPANIKVTSNVLPADKFFVHADPTQMHQAILNLCTNAFHALRKKGGSIEIGLSRMTPEEAKSQGLASESAGNWIKLSVADNGPGIRPEIFDKIFDPFFSTKSKSEGTGLGLAVVHGIVKSHQGTIRVFSGDSGGSTFEIMLPETAAGEDIVSSSLGTSFESGGRILFVEDDEDQLQTTPRLLEEMGFAVTALREPAAALHLASSTSSSFDIIITDFDMPGMSGTDLAGRLPAVPFILVSGRDDARVAARDHDNIVKVVIKPYDKRDLMEAIREVMKSEKTA